MNKKYDFHLPIYRSRHGSVLGVCRGIADHFDLPVFWVRVIVILLALVTAFWPVIIGYLIAGMLMKPEPAVRLGSPGEQEFYDSYTTSRNLALRRLKDQFDRLDRRIGRMEDVVTSREYTWKRQMR
jgi:phage shock protein C